MRAHAFFGHVLRVCRQEFAPSRVWQRFCSARCRSAARRRQEEVHLSEVLVTGTVSGEAKVTYLWGSWPG